MAPVLRPRGRRPPRADATSYSRPVDRKAGVLAIALCACTSSTPDGIGAPRAERPSPPAAPTAAPSGPRAQAIGVGEHWSCALLRGGDVRCWGATRLTAQPSSPRPISIGIEDAAALAVGPRHACVARADGSVWCWGDNRDGQLGDGTTEERGVPTRVPVLTGVVGLVAGGHHTCARDRQGVVWCWGHEGCVGHPRSAEARAPGRVEPMPPAAHLVAGDDVTCAFFGGAGAPRCWGFNTARLLGAELGPVKRPILSVPLSSAAVLAVGFRHACVAQRDDQGVVYCAGDDQFGQLGDQFVPDGAQCDSRDGDRVTCTWTDPPPPRPEATGAPPPPIDLPPPAPERHTGSFPQRRSFVLAGDGVRATALSAGYGRTCAITRAGTVSCWGQWYYGSDWSYRRPHAIVGTEGATALSVYQDHACAIVGDGEVRCWGYNTAGELGTGAIAPSMTATRDATAVRW